MNYFQYGEKEINHLKSKDKKLARAIDHIGMIKRAVNPDLFQALVNTIVGQQISSKAQKTIWRRMKEGIKTITPQTIEKLNTGELQQYGISFRKAGYIKHAASMVVSGELDIDSLKNMPDHKVNETLVKLPGIGAWTAEMLMIFSMQRPNIISFGDLAIQRGLRMLYGHEKITRELFARYQKRYSPYASVASLYLWAISGGAVEGLTDKAVKSNR